MQPYRVTFVLDAFSDPKDRALSYAYLGRALDFLTDIDVEYLKAYPQTPLIYESGVRYVEEPPGQEDWQDIPTCIRMVDCDCEELAAWRAAELRVRYGIQARCVFKAQLRPNGSYLFHILVEYPDGRLEDPSRILGMK